MTSDARQRRGKASSTSASSLAEDNKTDEQRINEAAAKVSAARERYDQASRSWRNYLFKISLVIIFIAAIQCQEPMSVCLSDIMEHNEAIEKKGATGMVMGVKEALVQVFNNGQCEWLGLALSGTIAKYLSTEAAAKGDFTTWIYMLSSMLFSLQITLYFQTKRQLGCAGRGAGGPGVLLDVSDEDEGTDRRTRQFPVGVIFHIIVATTLWLLKFGRDKTETNAKKVKEVKKQLDAVKKGKKS